MKPKVFTETIDMGDGREIILETGKLAKQAHGSVVVKMGDTVLLCTVVSSYEKSNLPFFPLTVDYREKFSAAGRFPGGYFKREGRPSNEEILSMRLVDRVLRPLFPEDYKFETQVMIQLMSHDEEVSADSLAGLAASTAIQLSDIPFECPISEVRVVRIAGEYVVNPGPEAIEKADIDMMIGASEESVTMVEGEMDEVSEEEMMEVIKIGHEAIKKQIEAQVKLAEAVGKKAPREYEGVTDDEELQKQIFDKAYDKCYEIAKSGSYKKERSDAFTAVKEEIKAEFSEEELEEKDKMISRYFKEAYQKAVRDLILKENIRLDGRRTTDIRDISCEVNFLPSPHGSALFTRGETQALATTTLGTSREANRIDLATRQDEERFYLHYNFPPFSTGEAYPIRGTSRREIGHGHLAQRALNVMMPDDSPYTVRVVSEVLESNGSSSMATVCAGSMAMMDAGVKLKKPVSGIAMGLIAQEDDYAVLSDILGDEDAFGDMDFKITGTKDGITACQMDIKVKGLSYEVMANALKQAREGRLHILDKMAEAITEYRETVKEHAPKIITRTIPGDYIGSLIGPGGKTIQELQELSETEIVINENDDGDGIVEILGTNQEGIDMVMKKIDAITFEPQKGSIYEVKVVKMLDFGAVVEYVEAPGKETLLHISELAWERTENVKDVVNMGDIIDVKYFGYDPRTKKEKISLKALTPRPERN
ncbi:MAG TPA: polyribonucleotide nucleotidyltransferase [Flavobacteriaceae bacterium]|nr:polyribonucleotide nucleotidyltransferase [Flavobacteriaceae bacterium]